MTMLGLTPMYLPLPHPMSAPKLPGFIDFKKRSTTGQG